MGRLANALQSKLNQGKSSKKLSKGDGGQLDLFTTLTERQGGGPRLASSTDEQVAKALKSAPPASAPLLAAEELEADLALPKASGLPPDVTADVRSIFTDESPERGARRSGGDEREGRQLPPTGIYRKPERPVLAAQPPRKRWQPRWAAGALAPVRRGGRWLKEWFDGAELNGRMVAGVLAGVLVVALIAYWSARSGSAYRKPGTIVDLNEIQADLDSDGALSLLTEKQTGSRPVVAPPKGAAAGTAAAPAGAAGAGTSGATAAAAPAKAVDAGWKVPGATVTVAGGVYSIQFAEAVFVSADNISVDGMKALKAVAEKLKGLEGARRVVVTGHTDNVPMSRPTPQFGSNADLAKARGKTAMEHLRHFALANKGLLFESRGGAQSEAPYANDTAANRRRNRTVTIEVRPR